MNKTKKIFLLDDVEWRLKKLQNKLNNKYQDYIILSDNLSPEKNDKFSTLKNYSLVIIHSSYINSANIIRYVQNYLNIPLIHFGGGYTDKFLSETEITLNSRTLYDNFSDFLDYLIANNIIELRILIYGIKYKLMEANIIRDNIFRELFGIQEDKRLVLTDKLIKLVSGFLKTAGYSDEIISLSVKKLKNYNIKEFTTKINLIYNQIK
jgi:hypothetical protein